MNVIYNFKVALYKIVASENSGAETVDIPFFLLHEHKWNAFIKVHS